MEKPREAADRHEANDEEHPKSINRALQDELLRVVISKAEGKDGKRAK